MRFLSLILIYVLMISSFDSCSKKQASQQIKPALLGQWKYIYSIGGFSGNDKIMPDSIETVQFNNNFTYSTYTNNQIRKQGKYSFTTGSNYTEIHFDTVIPGIFYGVYEKSIIDIGSDTLVLTDFSVSEPYTDYYVK